VVDIFNNNRINYLILFIISIVTLNYQDHSIYGGLDGSYFWAFNYIVSHQPQDLDKITNIYGPLAFLHNPVHYGYLIIIGTVFQILVKFTYGFAILKAGKQFETSAKTALILFGLSSLVVFSTEAYFSLICILFLLLYHKEKKQSYLLLIALFTIVGYYYKCAIGLSCALYQGLYYLYAVFTNKKPELKLFITILGYNVLFFVLIGLALFRSFTPIADSLVIYFQNIIMFNEISSVYNRNESAFLLILSLASAVSVFWFNKNADFRLFWLFGIFFLYTGYTHSIVRMDNSHYMGFLVCLFMLMICCILFYKHISKYTFPLLAVSFFSYYGNLINKKDYGEFILSVPNGPAYFVNSVFNHEQHVKLNSKKTYKNLKYPYKLSNEIKFKIKDGSVDFFPWDFGYVEANHLSNWKPRPFLQNLNMSVYFDKKTAEYFNSAEAPDFLIWHDGYFAGQFLSGIDNSYLLSNEINSIQAILKNYHVIKKQDNSLILEKNKEAVKITISDLAAPQEINSAEWIPLPEHKDILSCNVVYDFNAWRGIKKQIYRDDEFFIEYRDKSKKRIRKRIWPSDAKEFIWLNPYISNPFDSTAYKDIQEIRFINTNKSIHSGKLKIQFKSLKIHSADTTSTTTFLYKWFNAGRK